MTALLFFSNAVIALEFTPMSVGAIAQTQIDGVTYGIYHAPAERVSLHWQDADGIAYDSLRQLKRALNAQGTQPVMLMNAGIFTNQHTPAGLWIERGNTLSPLNQKTGKGNFHIQPNGVFYLQHKQAHILTTQAFAKYQPQAEYAVQSGPMLLIDGKINSRFIKGLSSPYKRNAVCTTRSGALYFIMTTHYVEQWPSFYQLSEALQRIGCYQALYLDGSISAWYLQGRTSLFHWSTFVGMIAVTQPHNP